MSLEGAARMVIVHLGGVPMFPISMRNMGQATYDVQFWLHADSWNLCSPRYQSACQEQLLKDCQVIVEAVAPAGWRQTLGGK